jgi:hypothetical protein
MSPLLVFKTAQSTTKEQADSARGGTIPQNAKPFPTVRVYEFTQQINIPDSEGNYIEHIAGF